MPQLFSLCHFTKDKKEISNHSPKAVEIPCTTCPTWHISPRTSRNLIYLSRDKLYIAFNKSYVKMFIWFSPKAYTLDYLLEASPICFCGRLRKDTNPGQLTFDWTSGLRSFTCLWACKSIRYLHKPDSASVTCYQASKLV